MMIKTTPAEVEKACEFWLRSLEHRYHENKDRRETTVARPVAIDGTLSITCKHTRGGVECVVQQKP